MDAKTDSRTQSERKSDRELVVTRTFDGPARIVYAAWTKPELLMRWWAPKSFGIKFVSCDADVRAGGKVRFVMQHGESPPMEFFGHYREVVPNAKLVWTNEEEGGAGQITTVTFEERGGKTFVVMSDLYPTKESLDAAIASGSCSGTTESYAQLDELLASA